LMRREKQKSKSRTENNVEQLRQLQCSSSGHATIDVDDATVIDSVM
jgi:hypothetical protein